MEENKIFCSAYRSFGGQFTIKITTSNVNKGANGNFYPAVETKRSQKGGNNLYMNNIMYISFENDKDYTMSLSFTTNTLYEVNRLFEFFGENEKTIYVKDADNKYAVNSTWLGADGLGKPIVLTASSSRSMALRPAISVNENGDAFRGAEVSINGSQYIFISIKEIKGIGDMLRRMDPTSYQYSSAILYKLEQVLESVSKGYVADSMPKVRASNVTSSSNVVISNEEAVSVNKPVITAKPAYNTIKTPYSEKKEVIANVTTVAKPIQTTTVKEEVIDTADIDDLF